MTKARKNYPSDVSDEEWAFCAPYLTLMKEDAPQREHALRELFNGQGARVMSISSQEFTARMTREIQQWTDLVARTGIKIE